MNNEQSTEELLRLILKELTQIKEAIYDVDKNVSQEFGYLGKDFDRLESAINKTREK